LDRAKNNIRIEDLRKINEDNTGKNSDFSLRTRIVKNDVVLNNKNII
jgi:hypothetical protein